MAAAAVLLAFFLLLNGPLSLYARQVVSDIGLLAGSTVAAVSCALRSQGWTGRRRRAWLSFTAAMASGSLGNLLVLSRHLGLSWPVTSWISTVVFLLGLLLGIAGLSFFPSVARRGTDFARMLVDGVIIGGAIITLTNDTVFAELISSGSGNGGDEVLLLLPLMLDVVTATLAVLLIVRIGPSDRSSLALLSGGVMAYAVCDLWRSVLTFRGSFQFGTPLDGGWLAGSLLITLAARHPAAGVTPDEAEERTSSPAGGTILIFTLVLAAAVLSMGDARASLLSPSRGGLWLLLVLAVGARQLLLILDNDRLRSGLERRVHERTTELRHATERSELLLSSVGDGIYGVDRSGAVSFINPAGARTLGYPPEDLIGRQAHGTFHARREDGTPFPVESCYVTEAIERGSVTNGEEDVYVRADGQQLAVEVTATPMAGGGSPTWGTVGWARSPADGQEGLLRGAVVVFRDVTQRQEVDRLKSEFVSMVSHELRTPLTSIRGSLGLLAGGALGALPPTALRMIDLALDSSARLTRLINDILDLERVEAGSLPMTLSDQRAAVLVADAAAQLQVLAAEADVSLVVADTPGVVRADPDRVVQLVINLIGNAIKFSPRHSVVEVSTREHETEVEFRIIDQGRGIPADKLDRVFTRFEQVDSSDAREKGGSGLGLAISRSMVERLGGRIWVESVEGAGATFFFTLPRGAAPDQVRPPVVPAVAAADLEQARRTSDPTRAVAGTT